MRNEALWNPEVEAHHEVLFKEHLRENVRVHIALVTTATLRPQEPQPIRVHIGYGYPVGCDLL